MRSHMLKKFESRQDTVAKSKMLVIALSRRRDHWIAFVLRTIQPHSVHNFAGRCAPEHAMAIPSFGRG
jgi:hypothetical protein